MKRATPAGGGMVVWAMVVGAIGCWAPLASAGDDEPAMIVIYDGFGTPAKARFWGRVLEDKGFDEPKKNERWTKRLTRSVRLMESDEIPGARVAVKVAGQRREVVADKEGLFTVELRKLPYGRHVVEAELLASKRKYRVMKGEVVIYPAGRGRAAVISDVDDTVLDTGVKHKARMLKRVLFGNARKLETFPGAPSLYQRFANVAMPVVFVSGSPINLYPRLRNFLRYKGFPRAPLRLKNLGVSQGSDSLRDQVRYKLSRIREAMELLPGWRFVLIGDSGEKDPEIYREAKKKHPRRVAAILIRNVGGAKKRAARFSGQRLFSHYKEATRFLVKKHLLVEVKAPSTGPGRAPLPPSGVLR